MKAGLVSVLFGVLMLAVGASGRHSIIAHSKRDAQRAFVFLTVRGKGVLLMVADKNAKGVHYQMPGGRIDKEDFEALGVSTNAKVLTEADYIRVGRYAALREIREETGFNVTKPEDMVYLPEISERVAAHRRGHVRGTTLPKKLFYKLDVDYEEFKEESIVLSNEHIGYVLEPDVRKIAKLVEQHSGGDPAKAVKMLHKIMITE